MFCCITADEWVISGVLLTRQNPLFERPPLSAACHLKHLPLKGINTVAGLNSEVKIEWAFFSFSASAGRHVGVEYVHVSSASLQISRRSMCIVRDGILNVMLRHHLSVPVDIIEGFVAETRRPCRWPQNPY